jgi:hypothetical protein
MHAPEGLSHIVEIVRDVVGIYCPLLMGSTSSSPSEDGAEQIQKKVPGLAVKFLMSLISAFVIGFVGGWTGSFKAVEELKIISQQNTVIISMHEKRLDRVDNQLHELNIRPYRDNRRGD